MHHMTPAEESPSTMEPEEHRGHKDMLSGTHFLQPGPAFHSSVIFYQSTYTLIYQWIKPFVKSEPSRPISGSGKAITNIPTGVLY